MGRGTLNQRRLSGGIAAVFVVLCMIAAALLPLASDHARAVEFMDPYMTVTGEVDGALAGRSVALMDIDGDGNADLIVGDPLDSENGDFSGKVMIYLGGAPKAVPDAVILGCEGEMFGFSVARAGDVNGDVDNIDDLIVGAPRNDTTLTDVGVAYIFYGGDVSSLPAKSSDADKMIVGEDFRGELGRAVSTAGDINSDGYDDVLIGVPNTGAGKAYVLYGGSSMDTTPDKTFYGTNDGDQFGFAVAGGANLDGTSMGDIVVGAPKTSVGKGATCVFLNVAKSSPKRVTLEGDVDGDQLGYSVAVLDFNDDGISDVAAGAPYANSVGEVGIYYGGTIAGKFDKTVDAVLSTGEADDKFGYAVASGDPRTDDVGDLVVGAPGDDTGGVDAGRAYVFYGDSIADDVPDVIVNGTDAFGNFGYCVASGTSITADFDGDGAADFAVGAPGLTSTRGAAYLYLGYEEEMPDKPLVFGYVLDATDLTPLGDALVTIKCQTQVFETTVRTLADGSYGVDEPIEVPPGTYEISASYDGYFSDSVEGVELANDDEKNVTLELYRFPEISGTIYDGATYPSLDELEDADVEVRSATGTLLYSATTDEFGAYSFVLEDESDLGDLTIEASKQDYFDNSTAKTIAGGVDETIDMVLQHKPVVEVHVVDAAVKPPADDDLADVLVTVSIGGIVVATGTTDSEGLVTLIVNGQGLAYVNTSKPGYVPGGIEPPVTLVENTTTTIPKISMDRRPSVSGTVYGAPDIEPISEAYVELLEAGTTTMLMDDTTDSDGYYTFDVAAPDTYDIRVTAAEYMREVRYGVLVDPNEEVIEDFVLSKDPIPPVSTITDPVKPGVGDPPTILEDPVFDLTVDASDANGISRVDLYVSFDDGDFELWAEDEETPYVFTFDSTEAYGDGIYAFYTRAWDLAENEEAAPSENDTWIIMNTGTPFSYVDEISPYEQRTTTFTVTAIGDDPFGVLHVELWYRFDGGTYEEYAQDDTLPYTWEFEATEDDGVYDFYSILVNGLGVEEDEPDEPDASALVDTTPPVITVDPPIEPAISTASVDLSVKFSDAGSGLSTVSYQVDSDDPEMLDVDEGSSEFVLDETLSGLADGDHTILLSATDMVEWETTEEISFVVDTGSPSVTIEAPLDGEAINTDTVEARWVIDEPVSGIESIDVWLDDGDPEDATGLDSYTFDGLDDEEHTITVYVVSVAGGDDTATTTFMVDTGDPTVVIREPVDGALIVTTNVFVRWEQSDLGSGLEKVEVRLDDGDWEISMANSTTIPNVDEGTHTVQVNATDKAGNWDMDEVTFGVDGTPPEITLLSPENGFVYDTGSVEASWEVTDDGTGVDVDTVEYKLDTSPWADAGAAVGTMTLPPLSEGTHSFSMRASDLAGNDAAVETVSFTVDTVDPTVVIDSPTDGDTLDIADVLVEYTVDGTGTSATVERSVDGSPWESAGMVSTLVESLAEGLHTVDIRATDEAGNDATASVEFTVDIGAPVVTITSPADGALLSTDSVTVEWTVSDMDATLEMKLDDGAWQPVTGTSHTLTDLSDGEHTVIVKATDDASNEGEDSVTFNVDTTPPTVSVTAPEEDAILGSSSVVVTWTAADAVTTERSVDGGAWLAVVGTSVTISSLVDGEHTISIRVTDVAGHEATDSVTILVDTTDPTVEITSPSEGATVVGAEVTVEWTADDGLGSGIDAVEVSIDGGARTAAIGSSHTFAGLTPGQHTVDVMVTDDAGNEGTDSVTFTVTAVIVDTTAPTVSITSPTNGSSLPSSSVTVTWTASDGTGSGIDTIEVKLDAGTWTVVTGSTREFTALAEGAHMVSVRVTDNAGNSATIGVTFMVDTVDPSLSITSPEDAWETEDTSVTVTWTCTDTGCGIDRIEVCIDGEAFVPVGTASERVFSDLEAGEHIVEVRAYDKAGNMVEASVAFTVDEGGGISALLIGGIVLAIIVLAAVAVMLMRRKKTPAPPMQE